METITVALIMITAVIASSWIVRMIPFPLPLPLVQIALGYAITAYGHLGVDLNPHVFMLLFLPPLLFLDGWRIPKEGLTKDIGAITQLAFGLVFLTVVGVGLVIHWMIPGMPLPVAFALAAVISPTDPVAVSAIAQKVPFPHRMMHILEGESLFNDASGLVCLKFAIAASMAAIAVATAPADAPAPAQQTHATITTPHTSQIHNQLTQPVVQPTILAATTTAATTPPQQAPGEETTTQTTPQPAADSANLSILNHEQTQEETRQEEAGSFSLLAATIEFIKMVVGGLLVGVLITLGITRLKQTISRRWGEETGTQILISLLIPFLAYIVAEEILHFSGVLAAVAAGITMSYSELRGRVMAVTRIQRNAVWDSLQILANGTMFVLLGEQLPKFVAKMPETVKLAGHENPLWLLLYILVITALLVILRWLWVWGALKVMIRWSAIRAIMAQNTDPAKTTFNSTATGWKNRLDYALFKTRRVLASIGPFLAALPKTTFQPVNKRLIAAMSMAGVRGSITLAGVLTIPLAIETRDLAIFLASGVILVTLVMASVTLPYILKGLELPSSMEDHEDKTEVQARNTAAAAAIKAVEQVQHEMAAHSTEPDLYVDAANRVMSTYRTRIEMRQHIISADSTTSAQTIRKSEAIERDMQLAALAAERDSLYKQAKERAINEELLNKLVREIDLTETSISRA